MSDYKKMYLKLFNAITDSIKILQEAQVETEKIYIEQEGTNITVLNNLKDNSNK